MSCSRKLLSAYLDGELYPGEEERLREHLRHCPRCRRELQEMRLLAELLFQWDEQQAAGPVPSDLCLHRLEQGITAETRAAQAHGAASKAPARLWKVAGVAAMLAGLVLAGWLAGTRTRQGRPDLSTLQGDGWARLSEVSYLAETPAESFDSIYVNLLLQEEAP
jgi:anti-sigma factor RsiW